MKTIVLDETGRDRRFENRLNEVFRHCRIGKVVAKRSAWPTGGLGGLGGISKTRPLLPSWPHDGSPLPTPQYMGKCGCKVGTVCCNVACPHRLVATS